ncbi:MAG TPA: glycosyltransferase family 4 protein [Opitutaceae bacterium]|nr:glycosyltransferase family 4 protein [Opitutaceae bacterium]
MSTEPPGVVILNDYASVTGGSTAVAVASACGLAAQGVPVTLFTAVGPVAPQLRDVPNLEVLCLGQEEIAKDPSRLRAFAGGWRNARAVAALRGLLARKDPARTVVHAHTWTKALSPFALSAVADAGFPLVVTLHDFFIACPNGGFFVHGANEICRRRPLSASCWACSCDRRNYAHKLWRNVRTVLQNRVLHVPERVAHYVAVSGFSLDRLRPYLPAASPATVVRNPVDCPDSPPAAVARNREFIFIGRFEAEKGVRLFAEAVRLAGVPAVFVGDGALRAEVESLCPQARFTGWLDPAAIRRELASARALVFPPLWYETLGLVVIEAAAAGVPALVADGCAATDYIRPDANGVHFTQGSAAALAREMTALAADDARAARLGRAAHDWYWDDPWTTERHVGELREIYRGLTAAGREVAHESVAGH